MKKSIKRHVIEIKDSCVVLQDKAYCTSESLSKEKPDTVVTETVKMPNKTDTQEDRKTKAQTLYKREAIYLSHYHRYPH